MHFIQAQIRLPYPTYWHLPIAYFGILFWLQGRLRILRPGSSELAPFDS